MLAAIGAAAPTYAPASTVSTTPTYADLRGSPDLLTQQVWANVFLEEAEAEEEEYNRDEGKAEEDSEGEEAAD